MLDNHVNQIALVCLIIVWLFAWTKGGQAERISVSVLAVNWIASMAIDGAVIHNPLLHELISLGADLILAIASSSTAVSYCCGTRKLTRTPGYTTRSCSAIIFLLLNRSGHYQTASPDSDSVAPESASAFSTFLPPACRAPAWPPDGSRPGRAPGFPRVSLVSLSFRLAGKRSSTAGAFDRNTRYREHTRFSHRTP